MYGMHDLEDLNAGSTFVGGNSSHHLRLLLPKQNYIKITLVIFLLKHYCLLLRLGSPQLLSGCLTVWLFDWLISISGVYPLGCYQTNFFRATILRSITGSNVIQQCISAAAASRQNYQGIGIMKVVSNYNCYADTQADLRYSQYSSKKCSSSLNAANETVAFLFTGITIHK